MESLREITSPPTGLRDRTRFPRAHRLLQYDRFLAKRRRRAITYGNVRPFGGPAGGPGVGSYVQKPLALSIREGRIMQDTAHKHNRIVQVGAQQRSGKTLRRSHQADPGKRIGRILILPYFFLDDDFSSFAIRALVCLDSGTPFSASDARWVNTFSFDGSSSLFGA